MSLSPLCTGTEPLALGHPSSSPFYLPLGDPGRHDFGCDSETRKTSYFRSFLEPRRTSEKALITAIQEAYAHSRQAP